MKNRRFVFILSVFLIVVLMCGLIPSACAENGKSACVCPSYDNMCPGRGGADKACADRPCSARGASMVEEKLERMRQRTLMNVMACALAAEEEQDPATREMLAEQTEALWNEYMDLVFESCEAEEPAAEKTSAEQLKEARINMLMNIMASAYAAEEEQDPAAQTMLLEQTEALWNEYMDLVFASCEAEEPAAEKTSAEQLKEARINMLMNIMACAYAAEEEQDPAAQAMLLEQTEALWTEYMDLVFASCEYDAAAEYERDIYLDDTQDVSCGFMDPYADSTVEMTEQAPLIGMPNPWTETESLDEAISISGISLKLPEEDALPAGMELFFFRAMPGTIEADYSNGTDELILRASLDEEGYCLAGDYNTYSREWKERIKGATVCCLGDGRRANVAVFNTDDLAYALSMACGREGAGLPDDTLRELVTSMQTGPEARKHGKNAHAERDIYADPQTQPIPAMAEEPREVEKNGEIMILSTGDVRAAIDSGFGYAGLKALRDSLEAQGYTTILVDTGDAIQGDTVGTVSKGRAIIDLMNALDYDLAVPGVHEFDYGTDQFVNLLNAADFPYISCSFADDDELALPICAMVEADGKNIAFIGVTDGARSCGTGESAWSVVQETIDIAREAGADLVYLAGNLSADEGAELIAHTAGADVFLNAFSAGQQLVTDRDGKPVILSGCGGQLSGVGFSRISATGEIVETGVWAWPNNLSAQLFFGIDNDVSEMVSAVRQKADAELGLRETCSGVARIDDLDGVIGEEYVESAAEGLQTPEAPIIGAKPQDDAHAGRILW